MTSPSRERSLDHEAQRIIAAGARQRLSRRSFLGRVVAGATAALGYIVIGPVPGVRTALAHGDAVCAPPCGQYCSGCLPDATCPPGYVTCTNPDYAGGTTGGCCPYVTGFWFVGNKGEEHMCRDCRWMVCPCLCQHPTTCYGYCACRSTVHYSTDIEQVIGGG